jgi:hypothetical protein
MCSVISVLDAKNVADATGSLRPERSISPAAT